MRTYLRKLLIFGEIIIIFTVIYVTVTMHSQATYLPRISSPDNYTTATEAPTPAQPNRISSLRSSPAEEVTIHGTDIGEILEERRARVALHCAQTGIVQRNPPETTVFRRVYADEKHHLVWCPIYKAASSTIMEIFCKLGNVLTPEAEEQMAKGKTQLNYLARKAFPVLKTGKMRQVLSTSNTLLVVRHPFERLLSAYRDKLEHKENREYYHRKYGRKIVQLFGNGNASDVPTFNEFLQYIAHGHPFDEHWRPFYQECAPCKIDYKYILKTENLQEEQEYLAYATNLKEFLPKGLLHKNPTGHTDHSIAQKYYSTISRKLLKQIYMIYQYDFQLFHYSADEYFEMTISNS